MKKIFLLSFAIFLGLTAFAQDYEIYKLKNGQTVVIQQVKTNPIVTMDTWIKTGSINENDKNNGVSHFLEHLFFKGTTNFAPGEFDSIIENRGAVTNAATSKDFTHYYITIPSRFFDIALKMHSDMLLNPLVPRKELEKERKVVIEEIAKSENSPNTIVYNNLIDMLYSHHPYKRKVIGTKEIIENIQREEIMDYYEKYYNPSNMITVIVGDVEPNYTLAEIEKYFNKAYQSPTKKSFFKERQLSNQKRNVSYSDVQSGYMLMGFRAVEIDNKDSYALDVLATILGDGRTSVLYQAIKEQKQLAFSVSAGNTGMRDDGIFYISANFEPSKAEKVETAIFDEISNIQKFGIIDEQLITAKNIIERDTYYNRESVSNIAGEIGYVLATTDDIKYYDLYLDNIKKVSPSDVQRVAKKYLGVTKSAISIVLPDDYKKTNEVQISDKNENTLNSYDAKLISENYKTQKYKLKNSATLLITPNNANDIVGIEISVKGGELIENIRGCGNLFASLLMKGSKNYSSLELSQYLEDNGIKIVPSIGSDAFTISVLTTKNEYEKTLVILDEIINNATLDSYELEKVRVEKLNNIKKGRDVPLTLAVENYRNLIYGNSPYSNSTIVYEKTFPQIAKSDIDAYYSEIFNPENIIISINGDVDKQKTFEEFTKMFTAKSGDKFEYSKHVAKIPILKTKQVVTKRIVDLKTDWIILGWQTAGIEVLKDYATLKVINSLLGTGMSSRLFKNLRDAHGLAYQVGSGYGAKALRGAFIVYIGTNPRNLDFAQEKMFEEIHNLKNEFVGTKELQDAKNKLIGRYVLSQETNLEKATKIGWYDTVGLGYEFGDSYEELIDSVTESDIIEVANKYFKDNYVLSIVKD
ncbi:MAG: pitrilysin family protein [Candidatus Gastranaerophilales bacterium]